MRNFQQSLSALCRREAIEAETAADRREIYANMLVDLSYALGRTIAIAGDGEKESTDILMRHAIETVEYETKESMAKLILAQTEAEGSA